MSINPYFNKTLNNKSSQNMIEGLTIEAIKMHGLEVYYIPREMVNEDTLFGEDTISEFKEAHMVEAFLDNIDAWGGEGEILEKFGLQSKDTVDLVLSKKRFSQAVIQKSSLSLSRPKEGDLVYIPLTKNVFEINFVEHENPFHQLGKLYTYKLTCELFRYSHENIETGNSDIDNIETPVDSETGEDIKQYAIDVSLETWGDTSEECNELDYTLGETVYQVDNDENDVSLANAIATANVIDWTVTSDTTGILRINALSGTFTSAGEIGSRVFGETSGANWQYNTSAETTVKIDAESPGDVVDNDDLQDFANEFLDFSEYNPFSEGDF